MNPVKAKIIRQNARWALLAHQAEYRISPRLVSRLSLAEGKSAELEARTIDLVLLHIEATADDCMSAGTVRVRDLTLQWAISQTRDSGTGHRGGGRGAKAATYMLRIWIKGEGLRWPDRPSDEGHRFSTCAPNALQVGSKIGSWIVIAKSPGTGVRSFRVMCQCGRLETRAAQPMQRTGYACNVCRGRWCVTCGAFMPRAKGAPTISCSPECNLIYRETYFRAHRAAKGLLRQPRTRAALEIDGAAIEDITTLQTMLERDNV